MISDRFTVHLLAMVKKLGKRGRRGALLVPVVLMACGSEAVDEATTCSVEERTGCDAGLVCENVVGGEPACFAPVLVKGNVSSTADGSPIEGAHVVARDANDVAISGVAVTNADGDYELAVPSDRKADGTPVGKDITLRADALGFLTFPRAPRVALPIDLGTATGDPATVQSVATDIAIIPFDDVSSLGSVSGRVLAERPGGTLVVAGDESAVADFDGNYTVFNVPAGDVRVRGFLSGVQLDAPSAVVPAGEGVSGVDLNVIGEAVATVSGTLSIVNAPGGSATSVILAVEETFVESVARGEVPPGLRAADVSGAWSIGDVPDGRYVVLAAFENDDLVRDPDTSIGGTEIQRIEVDGANVSVDGFKVTGALAVVSPGASSAEGVSRAPTFVWEDDSSEDAYLVEVYDALGELVWETSGNFDPGGNADARVTYAGPSLEPGMFYQFRATSLNADGVPLSRTEDLKGVFFVE